MGRSKSFIRKPGTEQILVRIGIGRDGVYKVDGMENKVRVQHQHVNIELRSLGDQFTDGCPIYIWDARHVQCTCMS